MRENRTYGSVPGGVPTAPGFGGAARKRNRHKIIETRARATRPSQNTLYRKSGDAIRGQAAEQEGPARR